MRQGSTLDIPTQDLYRDRLQTRRYINKWYEAPRHLPGREALIKVGFDQTTQQSWQQTLRGLEESFKKHDLKAFFSTINRLCSLKPSAPIVAGLETFDGEVIYNRSIIEKTLAEDFRERQHLPSLSSLNLGNVERTLFTTSDIAKAIAETNFNKGMGPDGFDGNVLWKSQELHDKVC